MKTIKENLNDLITDENNSRELIEKIAVIQNQVDEMTAEMDKQKSEYKDLLNDYAEVVKSSAFKLDDRTKADEGTKEVTFEGFLESWNAKQQSANK